MKISSAKIVGIINCTPDSFSDGGALAGEQQALDHAHALTLDGAEILDIGGESTRPGSCPIDAETEWKRIGLIVAELAQSVTLSIDTYRSSTAQRALEKGAKIINDISALRADSRMAEIISAHQAEVILMFSKEIGSAPHASYAQPSYDDLLRTIMDFLDERIEHAMRAGIAQKNIILDPGMGAFLSSDPECSWQVLAHFGELRNHYRDFRLLIGTSRKGFLRSDGETSPAERDPLSQLTALHAAHCGVDYIRTHNVKMCRSFLTSWQRMNQVRAFQASPRRSD